MDKTGALACIQNQLVQFTYCNQRSHAVDVVLIKLTMLSLVGSDSSDMVAVDDEYMCEPDSKKSLALRMCARDAQNGTFGKIAPRLKRGSMTLPATVLKSLKRPTHVDTLSSISRRLRVAVYMLLRNHNKGDRGSLFAFLKYCALCAFVNAQ